MPGDDQQLADAVERALRSELLCSRCELTKPIGRFFRIRTPLCWTCYDFRTDRGGHVVVFPHD